MNLNYKDISIGEALKVIESNNYCHIAFAKNNKPYLIPINYKLIKNYTNEYYIQISTVINCKKMNIIQTNKFVNINIEEVINNAVISIMCYGCVSKMENINEYVANIYIKLDYVTGRIISSNFNIK